MSEDDTTFQTKYARGLLIACVVGLVTVGLSVRSLSMATSGVSRVLFPDSVPEEHKVTSTLLSSSSSKHQTAMLKRVMEMNREAANVGQKTNVVVGDVAPSENTEGAP